MWFALWKLKTDVAIRNGCRLIVVTKKHGDVGYSQQGEIEYLKANDVAFTSISIYQFAFHHLKSALDMVLETDVSELQQIMRLLSLSQRQKLADVLNQEPSENERSERSETTPDAMVLNFGLQDATLQDVREVLESFPPELRQNLNRALALLEPPQRRGQEKEREKHQVKNRRQANRLLERRALTDLTCDEEECHPFSDLTFPEERIPLAPAMTEPSLEANHSARAPAQRKVSVTFDSRVEVKRFRDRQAVHFSDERQPEQCVIL